MRLWLAHKIFAVSKVLFRVSGERDPFDERPRTWDTFCYTRNTWLCRKLWDVSVALYFLSGELESSYNERRPFEWPKSWSL